MRFLTCPSCNGAKGNVRHIGYTVSIAFAEGNEELMRGKVNPCPTCLDDDGNPTGRVCVMGDGELGIIASTSLHPEHIRQATAELTHRKGGKGGGE